jgi:hypothetical protein
MHDKLGHQNEQETLETTQNKNTTKQTESEHLKLKNDTMAIWLI